MVGSKFEPSGVLFVRQGELFSAHRIDTSVAQKVGHSFAGLILEATRIMEHQDAGDEDGAVSEDDVSDQED